MKRKKHGRRILSCVLAASMAVPAVSVPVTAYGASGLVRDAYGVSGKRSQDGALEEVGGLELKGAYLDTDSERGNVLTVTGGWNNQNSGHANIPNGADLFGKKSFTLLADIKMTDTEDEAANDKKAAFTIGTESQNLHIFTLSGKLGYGDSAAKGGISENNIELANIDPDGWNSMALVYEEKDDRNGSVCVYINGEKAGEIADIGFKLSTMSDQITAMVGRSFKTSFLLNGLYDNIVVKDTALSEEEAVKETRQRVLQPLKKELKELLVEAKAYTEGDGAENQELMELIFAGQILLNDESASIGDISDVISQIRAILPAYDATIVIRGKDVDAAARVPEGLSYKGWGLLSCNGTSNLLMDYKAEAPGKYWELINTLFGGDHPIFTHIKIEMGNDGNTSTAADPATIRFEGEEADASRSPGWQLAADARSVNPEMKISVLRWRSPNWTNGNTNTETIYRWYRDTIFDAYEKYGIMPDYVAAGVNEARSNDVPVSVRMMNEFTERMENESDFPEYMEDEEIQDAYRSIKFVSADEIDSWSIVDQMYQTQTEPDGAWENTDAVGIHYVTGTDQKTRDLADKYNKQIWYSEGCASFGQTPQSERRTNTYVPMGGKQGPLAMADGFLNSFVFNRMTHYVFQPAVGAFYDGLQYAHKDLVSAREPWAGYVRYDEALYLTAHFTQFSQAGWPDKENSNGIWLGIPQASGAYAGDNSTNEHLSNEEGEPSYMTLADPDKTDFSVVAVNNSNKELTYRIKAEDMEIQEGTPLEIWQTKADEYMKFKGQVEPDGAGYYVVTIDPGAMATYTTLDYAENTEENEEDRALDLPENIPSGEKAVLDTDDDGKMGEDFTEVTDNEILYADDFDYEEEGDVLVCAAGGKEEQDYLYSRGNEPRYLMDTHGAWVVEEDGDGNRRLGQILSEKVSEWNGGDPETIVGDHRWMNYRASIDVQADNGYALLGIRQQSGMNSDNSGYNLLIEQGKWKLRKKGTVLKEGLLPERDGDYYNLALEGRENMITAYVDGQMIASYTDNDKPYLTGRVFLGSAWKQTYFDHLKVEQIPGYIPYADAFYDDHDDEVQYTGDWALDGPGEGSADNWYRTTAYNKKEGVSVSFKGTGTGFTLVGENKEKAVVDIYVDGQLRVGGQENMESDKRYSTILLDGEENKEHEFKVVVTSGQLTIDGVYILGDPVPGGGTEALKALVTECSGLYSGDYTSETWTVFEKTLQKAQEILEKEDAVQIEIDQADAELRSARNGLLRLDEAVEITDTELPEHLAVFIGDEPENMPEKVKVKLADGSEEKRDIVWEFDDEEAAVYDTAVITGTVAGDRILKVTIPVEIVPRNLVYFMDSFSASPEENAVTPVYEAVRRLTKNQLLNEAADQVSDGSRWGFDAAGVNEKGGTDINDKYDSGYYMSGGKPATYYLPLEAGTYSITAGAREWWNKDRHMKVTAYLNGQEAASDELAVSGSDTDGRVTLEVTLDQPSTVILKAEKTEHSDDPVISWVAAARADEVRPVGIEIKSLPDQMIYRIDEAFDSQGLEVEAIMSDGTRVILNQEDYTLEGYDSGTVGEKVITVTYTDGTGKEYREQFTVIVAQSRYYTVGIEITKAPDKTKYYTDEEFDPEGMKVEAIKAATASDAQPIRVPIQNFKIATSSNAKKAGAGVRTASSSEAVRVPLEQDDYLTEYDFSQPGSSEVTVIYNDLDADGEQTEFKDSLHVTVMKEELFYTARIRITDKPDKRIYRIGEEFDPEGMKVIQVLKGDLSGNTREEEISLDDLEYFYDFSQPGTQTVKICYYGVDKEQEEKAFYDKITVQVAEEAPEGFYTDKIEIVSLPNRLVYEEGERFDPAGMTVVAHQINRSTGEKQQMEVFNYQASPSVFMKSGNIKVVISYTGLDINGDPRVFRDNVSVTVRPYERSDSDGNEDSSAAGKAWEGKAAQTGWPSGIMDGGNWKRDPQSHVWTYIKADGNAAVSEWGCINGTWYFFGADGRMVSDQWIKDGPKWYFVNESGGMCTDRWVLYEDNWYYLGKDGVMAENTVTADGYSVDSEGRWIH